MARKLNRTGFILGALSIVVNSVIGIVIVAVGISNDDDSDDNNYYNHFSYQQ